MSARVTVVGLEEAMKRLSYFDAKTLMERPLKEATELAYGETQVYPPPSGKPMQWKTEKQRRWFFWALRSGMITLPYRRRHSGGLAGSFRRGLHTGSSFADWEGIVESKLSYAKWVVDPDLQSGYHKGNWWTTDDIAKRITGPVARLFQAHIRRLINL